MSYIAIDLGGTNTRVAVAEILDVPSFERRLSRKNDHDYDSDLSYVIESIRELAAGSKVNAVGIGVPGRINEDRTLMVGSNNLPTWLNKDFRSRIANEFTCDVYIDNDGIAAAMGEAVYGNEQNAFHYLIWGTGIGAVYIEHGENDRFIATYLRRQYHYFFEEWEKNCSGSGILKEYGRAADSLSAMEWKNIMNKFNYYLKEFIKLSGASRVIIGGGIAYIHSGAVLDSSSGLDVSLSIGSFGNDGGLVGALALIKNAQPS